MITKVEPIIRKAGEILLSYYGKLNPADISDKAAFDYVTIADNASEEFIISELRKEFPEIAFLAEESGLSDKNATSYWIIDPLDGTKNFIQNIPYFAISIALQIDQKIVFGAVYNPLLNELFYAETRKGAFLNGSPISISKKASFSDGFISTGFPFKKRELSAQYFASFSDIFSAVTNIRRCGAAALDLAYLAAGRYDGFWEIGLSPWDIAGASIIITEAGGKITDFDDKSNYIESGFVIAGNELFHQKLLKHIQSNFKKKG